MGDIVIDGKVKVTWLTTLAAPTAPSAAALNAGVHIEGWLTPDGLKLELGDDEVDTSKLNSTFTSKIAGRGTVSVELTFADQGKGNPPWTTFTGRPAGFLVVRRNVAAATTYAASQIVEVYAGQAGDPKIIPPAANEMSKFAVDMFPSTDPELHSVCAA